jgi:hypothetical protein
MKTSLAWLEDLLYQKCLYLHDEVHVESWIIDNVEPEWQPTISKVMQAMEITSVSTIPQLKHQFFERLRNAI